jgi:putatice virulence related protein PagC
MLKKIFVNTVISCSMFVGMNVYASNHSVTLGYAQTQVDNNELNLKGLNAQYRYEWDSPLGLLVSLTYTKGDMVEQTTNVIYETNQKYFSYMMGPTYRFNNYMSIYALTGLANMKHKSADYTVGGSNIYNESLSKTEFAYGAGLIINPTQNVSLNVGYEGTNWKYADEDRIALNGWSVGLGYRF